MPPLPIVKLSDAAGAITENDVLLKGRCSCCQCQARHHYRSYQREWWIELSERMMDCLSYQRERWIAWAVRENEEALELSERERWIVWALRENDELFELSERMMNCLSCQREWWIAWAVRENDGLLELSERMMDCLGCQREWWKRFSCQREWYNCYDELRSVVRFAMLCVMLLCRCSRWDPLCL